MCVFINILLLGVTSPRGGGFWRFIPPKQNSKPSKLKHETL